MQLEAGIRSELADQIEVSLLDEAVQAELQNYQAQWLEKHAALEEAIALLQDELDSETYVAFYRHWDAEQAKLATSEVFKQAPRLGMEPCDEAQAAIQAAEHALKPVKTKRGHVVEVGASGFLGHDSRPAEW